MIREQWYETWIRLRERWVEWNPNKIEAEDWCLGLLRYKPELVEDVARHIASTYSSKIPRLAWLLRECEKRIREESIVNRLDATPDYHVDVDEFDKQKEALIQRLEQVPINELREAYKKAMAKYGGLISVPDDGNPRNWKSTLRGAVYSELFGNQHN